jgi:adenosine deaminase
MTTPVPKFSHLSHIDYITLHPKLELHAHISGSINNQHLTSLIKHQWPDPAISSEKLSICKLSPDNIHDTRNLDECFALFTVLHQIINSKDIIFMVTLQVCEDFLFRDQAVYFELRTTPRPILDNEGNVLVTMEEYMGTVSAAIKEFRMIVHFLAQKYQIRTILQTFGVEIDFFENIRDYSSYGQEIINRFDNLMGINGSNCGNGDDKLEMKLSQFMHGFDQNETTTQSLLNKLELSTNDYSNNIPLPLTSPLSPCIISDFHSQFEKYQNNEIGSEQKHPTKCLFQHYHHHKYSKSSVGLAISSFVSCGVMFSIDRASFGIETGLQLLKSVQKLQTKEGEEEFFPNKSSKTSKTSKTSKNQPSNIPTSVKKNQQINSFNEIIVGLDFSGNPYAKNLFDNFAQIWEKSEEMGLHTSIHFAETTNEIDSNQILNYKPHRLGHAAVLHKGMRDVIMDVVEKKDQIGDFFYQNCDQIQQNDQKNNLFTGIRSKMGVEVCLSSNKACKLHTTIGTHPVVGWIEYNNKLIRDFFTNRMHTFPIVQIDGKNSQTNHIFPSISNYPELYSKLVPITLCTDDSGVFSCSLVDEWLNLLELEYFNCGLSSTNDGNKNIHGCYTYPITSVKDTNNESVSITSGPLQIHHENQIITIPRSRFDDFIRINNFAQTGIQSIFQKQYIHIVQEVMNRFRPVQ